MRMASPAPRCPSSFITSSRCLRARISEYSARTKNALSATSSAVAVRARAVMCPARGYFGACRRRSREGERLPDPADRSTGEEYLRRAVALVLPCRPEGSPRDGERRAPLVPGLLAAVIDTHGRAAGRREDVALAAPVVLPGDDRPGAGANYRGRERVDVPALGAVDHRR